MNTDFSDSGDETNERATFNEAFLQMRRINEMESMINNIRGIPLQFNTIYNNYNYEIIFSNLCSLLMEVWGKMTTKEKEEADTLRKLIQKIIRMKLVHKSAKDLSTNTTKVVVDNDTWFKLEDTLIEFEKNIRIYMNKHGLTNPNDESSGLFPG